VLRGLRTAEIACHLRCHPQTVRERFERFHAEGLEGLMNRPGAGRKTRLTEQERSQLIALVAQAPPSRPVRQADGQLVADDPIEPTQWSLDALVSAAHQQGIAIKRSQVHRVLLKEKVRWRQVRSWAVSKDPDFVPKGRRRVEAYTHPEPGSTILCVDELGPVCARSFAPAPGRSVDGHRIKAPLEYSRGLEKTWVYGALYVRDGQALTLSAPSRNTAGYLQLLEAIEQAYPGVKLTLIGDNR
jgi:transposase